MQIQLQYHNLIELVIVDQDAEYSLKIKLEFTNHEGSKGWPCLYLVV